MATVAVAKDYFAVALQAYNTRNELVSVYRDILSRHSISLGTGFHSALDFK